jgi:two-component system, NtrC family, sensor kinase
VRQQLLHYTTSSKGHSIVKHPKQSGEVTKLRRENERLRSELAETRLQQSTSAEVLKAISGSSFDLKAVLSTLAESAATLCGCNHAAIYLRDGDGLRGSAFFGASPEEVQRSLGQLVTIDQKTVSGRAILANKPVCIADVRSDAEYDYAPIQKWSDARALLGVPLLRNGKAEGVFSVARRDPGEYSSKQIDILQNFADQAVVAIENARLHDEVHQRNRELEATSDVLRVISSSPTDIQPVFQAIADSAAHLCGAQYSFVYRYDGNDVHFVAHHGLPLVIENEIKQAFPMKPGPASAGARAVLSGQVEQVPDVEHDPAYAHGILAKAIRTGSVLAVPMMRNGTPVGAIALDRSQVGPFPARQVELLKTFADQAVIAIENARLFEEVEARTVALGEALKQQTATADVLKTISRTVFDLPAVLETLVTSAAGLCDARFGGIFLRDNSNALRGFASISERSDTWDIATPLPINRRTISGRVVLSGKLEYAQDVEADSEYDLQSLRVVTDSRALLGVPLLKDGEVEGVFFLGRPEPGSFTARHQELIETFADQAMIAIENVRLFDEVQARTQEVSEALQQQTATAEVLKSISSSAFDLDAVLHTLVKSAAELCRATHGLILLPDGDLFRQVQQIGFSAEFDEFMRANPVRAGQGSVTGRVVETGAVVHI